MKVLQVKQYHKQIASQKEQKKLECWRAKENKYGYPVKSMFYFMLSDRKGYPTELRQKGYIAFNNHKAVFGINEVEATKRFNE